MDTKLDELTINGITYVRKGASQLAVSTDGLQYVIVRSRDAGVFAGYLKSRNGGEVTLLQSRRLWYWDGAASLSELAFSGVKKPANCKFPTEIPSHDILGVTEVIPCTDEARRSIAGVKIWTA